MCDSLSSPLAAEVEALKALAVSALEKVEALEKRVAELEAAEKAGDD